VYVWVLYMVAQIVTAAYKDF